MTIYKVDAGCSCRQADPAQLPMQLAPRESKRVTIGINGAKTFQPQTFVFTFSTTMGLLTAPATSFSLPKHHLSPDSITLAGLNEDAKPGEGAFELVHREVYTSAPDEGVTMDVPEGLAWERLASQAGKVSNAPGLNYRDVTWRLTVKDPSLGLHRADVGLKAGDARKILSIPIVWQRLPFLSSTPERVILSPRTTRVFLRCPDESVDVARVVSAPPGVKAVQDSPRSVAVSITEGSPDILDGVIEVETTAKGRDPLRVPVVRYAPELAK